MFFCEVWSRSFAIGSAGGGNIKPYWERVPERFCCFPVSDLPASLCCVLMRMLSQESFTVLVVGTRKRSPITKQLSLMDNPEMLHFIIGLESPG